MSSKTTEFTPGWGWPIAVVALVHLGLAAIPIHFSEVHGEEAPTIALSMVAAPQPEPPPPVVSPEPVEEAIEEPEPEPKPEPEPVVEANEPEPTIHESEVAIAEDIADEIAEPEIDELAEVDEPVEEEVVEDERDHSDEEEPELATVEPLPFPTPEPDVAPDPAPDPTPEPVDVDWNGYGQGVMQAVQATQNYPRMAQRMGWEGTVTVRITVGHDGSLATPPSLVESSRYDALDEEALRMVEAAAPFETFPGGSRETEQEFVIPVRFQLRG